jgi:hypothetical protein
VLAVVAVMFAHLGDLLCTHTGGVWVG